MKKFNFELKGNALFIQLLGGIYIEQALSLREEFLKVDKSTTYLDIVVDMKQVDYIDSSGLGVLITFHKRASEKGGKVTLKDVTGVPKNLIELTRLNSVFIIK